MKYIRCAALGILILSLLGTSACFPFKSQKKGEGGQAQGLFDKLTKPGVGEGRTLASTDGQSRITLPSGWKEDQSLHEKAEMGAANRLGEMYIIVLTEDRQDFKNMNLDKHSEITRGMLTREAQDVQIGPPVRLTINGYPAVQYEIKASVDNVNVVYLHTTVETPKNFHQIVSWTLRSRYDKNRPELQQVIESFKEIPKA